MSDPILLKARAVRLIDELADMVTTLNLMSSMQAGRVAKTQRAQILCAKAQAILQAVGQSGAKRKADGGFQICGGVMGTELKFPATVELAVAPRRHALGHPWYRGYPNNKRLRELAAEVKRKRRRTAKV